MNKEQRLKGMKSKKTSLFRRIPLIAKMAVIVIIGGIVIGAMAEHFHRRILKKILEAQFIDWVGQRATEDRMRFDQYIKAHYQSVKLFITQKRFNDYLDGLDKKNWAEDKEVQIKKYTQLPPWFPDFSVMRTFVQARFVLLLDSKRRIRETYQSRMDELPGFLLESKSFLYQLSQNQSFLTMYKNSPYVIASKEIYGKDEKLRAILTLASPIDEEFITFSQGTTATNDLVALVTALNPRILASNYPDLLPAGAKISSLQDRFLIMQEGFFDYGDSDLIVKFATFIPKTEIASLVGMILEKEEKMFLMVFMVFLLSFLLLMLYITQQIRKLTKYVVDFEKQELGLQKSARIKGDELQDLKDRFHGLAEEVLLSRATIKRESTRQTRMIINNALDAIIAINADSQQITIWNPKAKEIFGWSRDEMLGRKFSDTIIPSRYKNQHVNEFGHLLETGEGPMANKSVELTALHRDGQEFPIELSVSRARSGKTNIICAFVRDITKRKEMEGQLIQAGKMESVGRLAGGIAHDFNNILSAIIGYAEITLDEITEDNPLRKYIEIMYNSANRAANLTQQLLAFSRKQIIEPRILNLNILIDDIQKMLSKLIGEDIEIKVIQNKRLWNVKADHAQMEQIIINLVVNARDALSRGGTLTIATDNTSVNEEYSQDRDAVKPGKYVKLTISDTGCGMAEDVKGRVFEPFFTTKKKRKSTGLGLSMVYGIVKQNKGNIYVYSKPGEGTTFKIYLPRVNEEVAQDIAVKEESAAIPHGSETILVVEDDERVRSMTVTELSRIGYTVLEAGDGEDALNVYNEFYKKIDLIVTDVVMPKMGGIEFTQKIREFCPEIKVLYMSGYMESSIAQRDILKKGINFLQKPIKFSVLAQTVRKTLNKVG